MVAAALDAVKAKASATAGEKAALWEKLAADIARRVGHAVSRTVPTTDGSFIFYGEKRLPGGKKYVLVIMPDGRAFMGISNGTVDLDSLNPL